MACIKPAFSVLCVNDEMQVDWQRIDHVAAVDWPQAAPFQQSAPYATASIAQGARLSFACLSDAGRTIGHALVMQRRGIRLCLRGPVWTEGLDPHLQRRALRLLARGTALTLVMPETRVAGFGVIPLMTPRHVALWDLRADEAALMARMQGKWRNRLRQSMRQGVLAEVGSHRDLPDLVREEAKLRQSRSYRALPAAFTLALLPPDLRIWVWRAKGKVQASMCFIRHGTWATYHMGHASPLAREAGAHGVMLWHAALSMRDAGVTTLDLGDVNTEDAPSLAHFKLGTGAGLHALGSLCWVLPGKGEIRGGNCRNPLP